MNYKDQVVPSGQHYSGSNRIPNIHEFVQRMDRDKKNRDKAIDEEAKAQKQKSSLFHKKPTDTSDDDEQASHLPNTSSPTNPSGKATEINQSDSDIQKHTPEKHPRQWKKVKDPVTGADVHIENVEMDYREVVENPAMTIPNENLGKKTTKSVSSDMSGEEYRQAQDVTAPPDPIHPGSTSDVPIGSSKTSVLFYKTPSHSYEPMFALLEQRATALVAGIFVAIVVGGRILGGSLWGLIPLGACVSCGVFLWAKELIRQGRDHEWDSERERGETATINLVPESAEWMNTIIGIVWGLVNPEMFAAVADTLEDVMVASLPKIIENVRVADISQGTTPLRVLSLRALPNSHMTDVADQARKEREKNVDPDELEAMEQAGAYYNLEASVAYHAKPSGADLSSKAKNMGMQLIFYFGIKGLFGVPLPIWVELQGLVATVRIRLQMTPEPPFLKMLTFTLMGIPKVQAGCTPMVEKGVNVLNLPLVSNFVNWAIGTAASMYVAPKSMTLDIGKMLQGDDIKKETLAIGVLFIRIHKATGLSKQDQRGSRGGGSDPYITVSWSKFSKPQFCTRVIQDTLNPVFQESCALLLTPDLIRADERLSMELWDSDRASADDVVGKVELDISELLEHPGQMFPQESTLRGVKAESTMPGKLHWEVGFFGRASLRKELGKKQEAEGERDMESIVTDDKKTDLSQEDQKEIDTQIQKDEKGVIENEMEEAVMTVPPDPQWPSGIVSIVVHQIAGLELANIKGSSWKRKGREYEPARAEAGEVKEEQSKKLPSSYCTILQNDELIYKTRTKVMSSQPIFNAGTERFVRDWRKCIMTVTVRDSRNRQHDPIIGVVPLKLGDILKNASEKTHWYPLDGGIGFGRIRISVLFRSVELKLPPRDLGWDVGTFEFTSDRLTATGFGGQTRMKLHLRTGGSSHLIRKDAYSRDSADGNDSNGESVGASWDISGEERRVRLPVRYRYRSPIFIEFLQSARRKPVACASLWLSDLADGEEQEFTVPIWKCDNELRLSQNYITPDNVQEIPDLDIEEVGRLHFRGRFSAGTDRDHARFVMDNNSRETIETWEACFAEGVRQEEVRTEVPANVQKLYDVAEMSDKEKQKWMASDGTDWSQAFGGDLSMLYPNPTEAFQTEGSEHSDPESSRPRRDSLRPTDLGPIPEDDGEDWSRQFHEDFDDSSSQGYSPSHSRNSSHNYSLSQSGEPWSSIDARSSLTDPSLADGDRGRAEKSLSSDRTSVNQRQSLANDSQTDHNSHTNHADLDGAPRERSASRSTDGASVRSDASHRSRNPIKALREYRDRNKDLHRAHRGLMQWRPIRNADFAKNEALFALRRVKQMGALNGRKPDVETEV